MYLPCINNKDDDGDDELSNQVFDFALLQYFHSRPKDSITSYSL